MGLILPPDINSRRPHTRQMCRKTPQPLRPDGKALPRQQRERFFFICRQNV